MIKHEADNLNHQLGVLIAGFTLGNDIQPEHIKSVIKSHNALKKSAELRIK